MFFTMSLNLLQSRFLEYWRLAGGVNASYDAMIGGEFSDHVISVICKDEVGWTFDHVGCNHIKANGFRLQGEVLRALPADEVEPRLRLYNSVSSKGRPVKVEEIGVSGLSQRTWTSRIFVGTAPPPGASAAVVSVCEWLDRCDVLDRDDIRDVVAHQCPPWIVDMFKAQDPSTLRTRGKILKMIANGDFGVLSASDLAPVSVAIADLKNSVELGISSDIGLV